MMSLVVQSADEQVPSRPRGREIHSDDAVPFGGSFFGCSGEGIESVKHAHVREAG